MKEWTREERYRVLKSPEEVRGIYERIRGSAYRQAYHVQPVTGLSSDPNGFAFHQGKWHLFYQWCPWGAVHGLKYWYHVTSEDLIRWKNEGVGLKPDTIYDNKGTHSGSALPVGDELYLFYTGNHRDENWVRTPWTCAARLSEGVPVKLPEPLFGPRPDYSEHQRDPKAFYNAERGAYYIFIGAQTLDKRGCVLVYESKGPLEGWTFAGRLTVPGYERFGGMWECPCIERIDGKDVLIFSPQYTKLPGRAGSTNHNVYLTGSMDYETLTFTPEGGYRHLDFGFDFYAAQLAANADAPDRNVLIAWMGLPDNHYPTEEEDWEGSLTLPRELRVKDGRLLQTPVSGIETLREQELAPNGLLPAAGELEVRVEDGDFDLNLFTKEDGSGGMRLRYRADKQTCTVDRAGLDKRFNEQVGEVLDIPLERRLSSMRIFLDKSSVEFFVNDGEAVFTSHVYPTDRERHYTAGKNGNVKIWKFRASVIDDFVI